VEVEYPHLVSMQDFGDPATAYLLVMEGQMLHERRHAPKRRSMITKFWRSHSDNSSAE